MKGGRPVAVCALIALAAHAALLLEPGRHAAPHGAAATSAVTARITIEAPAKPPEPAPPGDAAPAPAAPPETAPAAPTTLQGEATSPDTLPPAFADDALPGIGFPDAQLPAQGVQLRAYVELAPDGGMRQVSTASAPGATPPPVSFQKVTEAGLRQARFKPGLGSAYCLLVRFEPDTPVPTLAWLPGAARDARRCLAGRQPAPRELEAAEAP